VFAQSPVAIVDVGWSEGEWLEGAAIVLPRARLVADACRFLLSGRRLFLPTEQVKLGAEVRAADIVVGPYGKMQSSFVLCWTSESTQLKCTPLKRPCTYSWL